MKSRITLNLTKEMICKLYEQCSFVQPLTHDEKLIFIKYCKQEFRAKYIPNPYPKESLVFNNKNDEMMFLLKL